MKRTVRILTRDKYLYQKIFLLLRENYTVVTEADAEVTLLDTNTEIATGSSQIITMSRMGEAQLSIPFRAETLLSLLSDNRCDGHYISLNGRVANLSGRFIRLTEVEAALLQCLIDSEGRLVSKEELLSKVWGKGTDGGVVNVYVHYLREKLEVDGEKVILSSRGKGYRINEKFSVRRS